MEDRQAVIAAQHGETEGTRVLFEKYQELAYGHALALLGSAHDAQDAVQNCFLKVIRKIHTVNPAKPFFPWLYVVLRNECYAMLRRRRSHVPMPLESFATHTDRDEHDDRLQRALGNITASDREVLVLKYVDGFKYAQIAEMLSLSLAAVTSRLHAARQRFLEHYGPQREEQ